MKLGELHRTLDELLRVRPADAELAVVIARSDPSMGARSNTPLMGVSSGFDWDHGKLLLWPSEGLYKHDDEGQIKQLRRELDKLAYEASSLRRENAALKKQAGA